MPRAAVLSVHARVRQNAPEASGGSGVHLTWARASCLRDRRGRSATFTLGRLPTIQPACARARRQPIASKAATRFGEAGHGMGIAPNALRYAAATGRVLIRWDGARQPTGLDRAGADVEPRDARRELARRFLHASGPGTARFGDGPGSSRSRRRRSVADLADELTAVRADRERLDPDGRRALLHRPRAPDSYRRPPSPDGDATPSTRAWNGSSSSRTPSAGRRSGRRGSGPAPCSSAARSEAWRRADADVHDPDAGPPRGCPTSGS